MGNNFRSVGNRHNFPPFRSRKVAPPFEPNPTFHRCFVTHNLSPSRCDKTIAAKGVNGPDFQSRLSDRPEYVLSADPRRNRAAFQTNGPAPAKCNGVASSHPVFLASAITAPFSAPQWLRPCHGSVQMVSEALAALRDSRFAAA